MAGLSDFSKDIKIVDTLSRLHLTPVRGIVERRLSPAETGTFLEFGNDGHVQGLSQEAEDCLVLRHGFEQASFPKDNRNYNEYKAGRKQNRNNETYAKAVTMPRNESHNLYTKHPELQSYLGGPLPLHLFSGVYEENLRYVKRDASSWENNDTVNVNDTLYDVQTDTYVIYLALMPLWTGEVYAYVYWTIDIPEPFLSKYIQDVQNMLTRCARPAPLPYLGNVPGAARNIERLGVRRAISRYPEPLRKRNGLLTRRFLPKKFPVAALPNRPRFEVVNSEVPRAKHLDSELVKLILERRGPAEHIARRRKTRRRK